MFHQTHPFVRRDPARELACTFFDHQGAALANAAGLLGGTAAARRVLALAEELRQGEGRLSVHTHRRIARLHALLSLDPDEVLLDDFDFSCEIDPADPRVHDICMLSEALGSLLRQISKAQAIASAASSKQAPCQASV